jgi:hypothetical protein
MEYYANGNKKFDEFQNKQLMKHDLYNILEKPSQSKYGFMIQKLILINIGINILSFMIPYFFKIDTQAIDIFETINMITVMFFMLELLIRYSVIGCDARYKGIKGKVKFTFTHNILIDIVSIVPFILAFANINASFIGIIRLLRFIRILKLIRMKKVLQKLININAFASSHVIIQSLILFFVSLACIFLFSYGFNSFKYSALIFLDPSQIAELNTHFELFIGIIELFVGLFIGGALISIITSSFIEILNSIDNGYFKYKSSDHIVIINYNLKLEFIITEINKYYYNIEEEQDIVILIPASFVQEFKANLDYYDNLEIIVIAGDTFNWNSYERVNINKAQKILLLLNKKNNFQYESKKISRFIVSHNSFTNKKASFVIETEQMLYSKEIYSVIFKNTINSYILVNHQNLIDKFLNRSVVNHDYLKIFSSLLSFNEFEFYTLNYNDIFEQELSFSSATLSISEAIFLGIVRDNKVVLNPSSDLMLLKTDKLIMLMKDRFTFTINNNNIEFKSKNLVLEQPNFKEKSNIIVVGNHSDISIDDITQFLEPSSVENLKHLVHKNGDYMDRTIWDSLDSDSIDIIILNLEDEYEFNLSLYLQSIYFDNDRFLLKFVNIFTSPRIAMLLGGKNQKNSMILSEQLVGEFIAQSLFNIYIHDIFDEITQLKGNELYIIDKLKYVKLYHLSYLSLKSILLRNNMIYIGAFISNEFIFDYKILKEPDKIVVLTQGKED